MSNYLRFDEINDTGKTKVWEVNHVNGTFLGEIKWFSNWRRYVFMPINSLLDSVCLGSVKEFIDEQMDLRKKS